MNQRQRRCTACIDSNQGCILFDNALFKQPPQVEDCPICFLRLPSLKLGKSYKLCCGKVLCSGCLHAPVFDNNGNTVENKCPFCRLPIITLDEDALESLKKRIEVGDAKAMNNLGRYYDEGKYGLPQDHAEALELYLRAGELGEAGAYNNISYAYFNGRGVARDEKKALHYWELAAMRGDVCARYILGIIEENRGNIDRALKHFMIAVEGGYADCLKIIKQFFMNGHATKDDYEKALRAYQAYLDEIRSDQRDAAAKVHGYRYY